MCCVGTFRKAWVDGAADPRDLQASVRARGPAVLQPTQLQKDFGSAWYAAGADPRAAQGIQPEPGPRTSYDDCSELRRRRAGPPGRNHAGVARATARWCQNGL